MSLPVADGTREELGDFVVDKRLWLLSLMALPVGVLSACLAKVLLWLIALFTNLAFFQRWTVEPIGLEQHHLGLGVIFVPVIGALIIGVMARYGSEKIRGHGIPEALEAILLGRSVIQPKVAILKPLSSAISIGTGGPFGAEGPIIMTGGAFGSLFAQFFHLTAIERKTLLVAGAAGGMSAIFATPVAAVLLAVELLLFEWRPRSLIPVAIAAMVAFLCRKSLLGDGPVFEVIQHADLSGGWIACAAIIGAIAGCGAILATNLVYGFEDLFGKLRVHWMWWPAIGAVLVGVAGYFEPKVLGVGYESIHALLRGEMLMGAIVSLVVLKALVWSVALGSGTSGGVLAPLLLIGGGLGALAGHVLPMGDPGLWAMVGMAAMMTGTMRAPLTSVIFLLELTHDFNALPLLMAGSLTALLVTVMFLRRSILTEKLARRGQHITQEYQVDPFALLRVGEAMGKDFARVKAHSTVAELLARIEKGEPEVCRRQAIFLLDENDLLDGVLTRSDLLRSLQNDASGRQPVSALIQRKPIVAYADEVLNEALTRMMEHEVGRLPVVARANPRAVVGYLGRADLLAARRRAHNEEKHFERGPMMETIREGLFTANK